LFPGAGKQNRVYQQWRPLFIGATQSITGSYHTYRVCNFLLRGISGANQTQPYHRVCTPGIGSLFHIQMTQYQGVRAQESVRDMM